MAETLSMLSIISFAVAGVAFIVAIILWISFKIPRIIGDLSGRNARKSIARVRASNEKSGEKSYRPSPANEARGKLTSNMPQTQPGQPTEEMTPGNDIMPETGLLAENKAAQKVTAGTELLSEEDSTGILADEVATVPLDAEQAPILQQNTKKKSLHMIEEIVLIHTDEVIE